MQVLANSQPKEKKVCLRNERTYSVSLHLPSIVNTTTIDYVTSVNHLLENGFRKTNREFFYTDGDPYDIRKADLRIWKDKGYSEVLFKHAAYWSDGQLIHIYVK